MFCMISVLAQQCSSTSNPAARIIRAAVLNSRFKCSSGACEEIVGVMEISEKIRNSKKYSSSTSCCWVLACTSHLDYKSLLQQSATLLPGVALDKACRLEFGESLLRSHAFGPHSQRGALGSCGRSITMITREAYGPHSTRGALGSNFGRPITMITREVLELEVRALLTDSSLYCRELPLYRCCSKRPAYSESRQRSAVVYSSISRFCSGVLGDTKRVPCAWMVDLVQPVMWWRSIPLGTSITALASIALIECVGSSRYAHSLTARLQRSTRSPPSDVFRRTGRDVCRRSSRKQQ